MKRYGILAHPAGHSLSPFMHNAAFHALGMDAKYEVFDVEPDRLEDFLEDARENIEGFSVSLPHKERIMEFLDEMDEASMAIGAVNTVVNEGGRLLGYNTDYSGALKALGDVAGKRVVLIGAGGAAKAIYYGLYKEGCDVSVFNRDSEKARALAGKNGFGLEVLGTMADGDILVQCTSLWLHGGRLEDLISREVVERFNVVMDIVYKPLITPLLEVARDAGVMVVTGEKMLLHQAVGQFEIWTGEKAPVEVMAGALEEKLSILP